MLPKILYNDFAIFLLSIKKILDTRIKYTYIAFMTAREILKLLHDDGWFEYEQTGSHIQLKHPTKSGRVTVPNHKGDLKKSTVHSILKQAGLK